MEAVGALLVGLLFLVVGIAVLRSERRSVDRSERVSLTVIDAVEVSSSEDGPTYRMVYEVAHGAHAGRRGGDGTSSKPALHRVGDKVTGFLDLETGDIRSDKSSRSSLWLSFAFVAVGGGLMIAGLLGWV